MGRNTEIIKCLSLGLLLALPGKGFAVSGFSFEAGFDHPVVRWIDTLPTDVERRLRLNAQRDVMMTLGKQLDAQLRDEGLHPFIEFRTQGRDLGLAKGSGELGQTIEFWLAGKRIYGFGIKAVPLPSTDQNISLAGNIPALDQGSAELALQSLADWPDKEASLAVARDNLQPGSGREDDNGNLIASVSEPVFFATGANLVPAWRFELTVGSMPYEAISDGHEIFRFSPRFFDATQASANIYSASKTAGTLKNVYFSITDGQNNLQNNYFTTAMAYPTQTRGTVLVGKFDFPADTAQFREANLFGHASEHLDYLLAQGYKWTSSNPITVRVSECLEDTCNCKAGSTCSDKSNAYYAPMDSQYKTPSIRVAEGDGLSLKDLHFDSGVVSHELGHHVVFSAITTYSKNTEALQLHEGLADFFVMMRSGSPCLGSGICPSGALSICYTNQCLRTAENDLLYGSAEFLAGADHQKGQLISGLLWDIKLSGVDSGDLVKIVLGAIDLLPQAANFGDFANAIQNSDRILFNSTHQGTIEQKILGRRLNESLASAGAGLPADSTTKRKSSGNLFGCTVMANPPIFPPQGEPAAGPMQMGIYVHAPAGIPIHAANDSGIDISLALLLAIPLLIGVRFLAKRLQS